MPNWDDHRGRRADWDRDRDRDWRRDDEPRQRWSGGDQRRSFESARGESGRGEGERGRYNSDTARYGMRGGRGEGEQEPWRRDRYGSRYDQDRAQYGAGYDYARGDYGRGLEDEEGRYSGYGYAGGEPLSYAGQEYGMEGHGGRGGPSQGGTGRSDYGRPDQGRPAYGAAQGRSADHEFDPDYLRWRDEQLSGHDRDYQEWRAHQHRQYDDDYRKFRSERREQFGRTFHDWRNQRTAVGGIPDTAINSGQSGYGDPVAIPGGNYLHAKDRPTGAHDAAPGHLADDPALQQTGVSRPSGGGQASSGASGSAAMSGGANFDAEPSQVKSVTGGGEPGAADQRNDAQRRDKDARH